MNIFVPIVKVDTARREVYGVMAEESPDKSNEIFDYATSKPYVKAWSEDIQRATDGKSFGNVRAQHSNIAAGKLVGVTFDDQNKCIPVVAKIVDDNEWRKVQEGVYSGFSIGGAYLRKWPDGAYTRYTAKPAEVSIVDNPCMRGARFSLVKADGGIEYRSFSPAPSNELAELRVQLNAQFAELLSKLNGLIQQREAASRRFNINGRDGVQKSDGDVREMLNKALDNGTRVDVAHQQEVSVSPRFQTVESVGSGQRMRSGQPFDVNGIEKSDTADAELRHALGHGKPVGFVPRA